MYYKTLNITTIEEEKKHLQKTEDKDLRRYRLNTFDGFVEYWGIEYFFNPEFKWDLPSICDKLPGLDSLLDHTAAFVDEDGNCFLLLHSILIAVTVTAIPTMHRTVGISPKNRNPKIIAATGSPPVDSIEALPASAYLSATVYNP